MQNNFNNQNENQNQNEITEKQKQEFSILIESIKLKLALLLAKNLYTSFNIINRQIIDYYNNNDLNVINFIVKAKDIVENNKNLITADLQKQFVKAIDIAKDVDNNYFNKNKTKLKPSEKDLLYANERATQQTKIIAENLNKAHLEIYTKADEIYQEFRNAKSFKELKSINEFKNLSKKMKNLLKKNFEKTQEQFEVVKEKNTLLKEAKKEIFKDKIVKNTKTRISKTSYYEVSATIEKTRFDTSKEQDKKQKIWIAKLDDKTRHTHFEADGKTQNINEAFQIRNPTNNAIELLMHPGDTSLGASLNNVIACRCLSIYI